MKIVVCVKQVPDTAAKVVVEDGQVTWGDAPLVINPWDEYAVETALLQEEAHGGEVTAISVGGEDAKEALKHALAMGCSNAILVSDPSLKNADSLVTSQVLAAAIQKLGDVDVVFFGKQAIDGDVGVTAAQTARILGWPSLTLVSAISELDPGTRTISVERSVEEGRQVVSGELPAVVSVVKDIGEPRYPSFMGIRKASRAEIPLWNLAELEVEVSGPVVEWPELSNPPKQEVVTEIISGASSQEIAETLAEKIIEEKVL
ncbi:MAG: electron transfer flavoprotein subunit beta/FixA family protein [Chloroflexota bacterium]|nr:MAG: electron transfer flavoprotein subunit beta/FixA family protein [Chloroflexota bacterium]